MPVGPKILCPEKTKKSAPRVATLIFWCEIDCAPSTSVHRLARRASGDDLPCTGTHCTSALDTWRHRDDLRAVVEHVEFIEQHLLFESSVGSRAGAPLRAASRYGTMLA